MISLATVFTALGRRFSFVKRSSLLWVVCVLVLMFVAHLSLVRVQIDTTALANTFSSSTPSGDASECGEGCVDKFVDEFLRLEITNEHVELAAREEEMEVYSDDTEEEKEDKGQKKVEEEKKGEEEGEYIMPTRERGENQKLYKKDTLRTVDWTDEMQEERETKINKRRRDVEKNCRNLNESLFTTSKSTLYEKMRWVTEHKFVWCPMFKVASTTWVKNLLILGKENFVDMSLHGRVRELFPAPATEKERRQVLRDNLKLLIVRHPLERLLSAYRDKMLRIRRENDPYRKMQLDIMKRYPDPDPQAAENTHSTDNKKHPTFTQFLLKVQDDMRGLWNKKGKSQVNLHWRPIWFSCDPCGVHYDVIAHVETLDEDNEYIIHKLGLEDILVNARTHASNFDNFNDTSEAVKGYFRQVPLYLLKDIVRFYEPDFTLFGYSPDEYLKLARKGVQKSKSKKT